MTPQPVVNVHTAATEAFDALVGAQRSMAALVGALAALNIRDLLSDPEWNAVIGLDGLRTDLSADTVALTPALARVARLRRLSAPEPPVVEELVDGVELTEETGP